MKRGSVSMGAPSFLRRLHTTTVPLLVLVVAALVVALNVVPIGIAIRTALAEHGTGSGQSFTFLDPGFTQEIVGISSHFMGGVAFAPDGDVWVNDCRAFGIRHLHRYDIQGVAPEVNGTRLHPESIVPSNAGCGMTNHPDGFIYSNTGFGVVQIEASTGAPTGVIIGPPGDGFGIAPDPQTGDLVYAAQNCDRRVIATGFCDIITVDPDTGSSSIFVRLTGFDDLIDGVYFHPDGSQLFLAKLVGFAATIIDRDFPGARTGTFNRDIPLPSQPDGIAFHDNGFVVTTNIDGTISKIVLGPPDVVSVFASGGGRNDLSQVGSDRCLYTTQDFLTRYDDGTETDQSSLVRICPGFVPPPGIEPLCLGEPATDGCTLIVDGTEVPDQPCVGTPERDVIFGTEEGDVIIGLGGNDIIKGRGGDDLICGDAGRDNLHGNNGDDELNGGDDHDNLQGNKGFDICANGENNKKGCEVVM